MSRRIDGTGVPHPFAQNGGRRKRVTDAVIARDGGRCWICHHPGATSADHVHRVADGGDAWGLDNLRAAHFFPCKTCGRRCQQQARPEVAPVPTGPLTWGRGWGPPRPRSVLFDVWGYGPNGEPPVRKPRVPDPGFWIADM